MIRGRWLLFCDIFINLCFQFEHDMSILSYEK